MKRIIQLVLFLFILIITVVFYRTYFVEDEKLKINSKKKQDKILLENKNNLIKSLRYEVTLDQNKQYIISADLSEISYENDIEVVKMQKVVAIFVDEANIPLTITSNNAVYNNSNYNTNFTNNVKVDYLSNLITSDNMDLEFDKNIVSIYENVKYEGFQGTIKADNVKIDLITKKIDIYMKNSEDKVKVITEY